MMRFRKATLRCVEVFCFALLLIDSTVSAQEVTEAPTSNPTRAALTVSPTILPTFSPTIRPTFSPTANPTKEPTEAPSEALTTATTLQETMIMISLFPETAFDLILENHDVLIEEIKALFLDFLDGVLEEISSTYKYSYSRAAFNAMVAVPNRWIRGENYRITIDGVVYYFDETPTMETLAHSLHVYFSFLGGSNLENYLLRNGFGKANVFSVDIDGKSIEYYDAYDDDETQNIFVNEEGELSKRNIVGFYVLFVMGIVTIALIVYRILLCRHRRHRRRRRRKDRISNASPELEASTKSSEQNDEESGIATKVHSNRGGNKSEDSMPHTVTMKELTATKSAKPSPPKESKKQLSTGKRRSQKMKKKDRNVEHWDSKQYRDTKETKRRGRGQARVTN